MGGSVQVEGTNDKSQNDESCGFRLKKLIVEKGRMMDIDDF